MPPPILFIPGISGLPDFHAPLQADLNKLRTNYSAQHADQTGLPYVNIQDHVDYWENVLKPLSESRPFLVGVSFGTSVAISVASRNSGILSGLVLISMPLFGCFTNSLIRMLKILPESLCNPLIRTYFIKCSDFSLGKQYLDPIRQIHYDNPEKLGARLQARLLALQKFNSLDAISQLAHRLPIRLIYGKNELIWFLNRKKISLLSKKNPIHLHVISGNHSIGIIGGMALIETFESILREKQ